MIRSCSNALISSSIASLQRVTDRTPENRISILKSGIQIAKRVSAQTTVEKSESIENWRKRKFFFLFLCKVKSARRANNFPGLF